MTVRSVNPDATFLPSGENAMEYIESVWPVSFTDGAGRAMSESYVGNLLPGKCIVVSVSYREGGGWGSAVSIGSRGFSCACSHGCSHVARVLFPWTPCGWPCGCHVGSF